ncbi:hypothetical protein DYB25_011523 [Aphanomyces astaci]|uniref:B box-type domain-containing protein n=1 Tax=Aphanomyces astaci TaxID=112090 RepID=A0A396ZXE4_APHAT|nr:hypothetical protein DYB25_011523 [Aphanomyces astaci]
MADAAAEKMVLDAMFDIKWDFAKCNYNRCLRLADLRCPKCVGEFYCQEHKKKHLKARHGKKELDDYGAKICENCTNFKIEFYCMSCKRYMCYKCVNGHLHPVYPVSDARGLCNAKLSWNNAFLADVSKFMVQYKDDMPLRSTSQPPKQPAAPKTPTPPPSAPIQQPSPPPPATTPAPSSVTPQPPHDPRKQTPSAPPNKPRDPRQPIVKQELVQPPPPASVPPPVAVQRPVKAETLPSNPLDVLANRGEDKEFITSASLTNLTLPHVGDNYLKGVMLDNYNKSNNEADRLDKAIRKLEKERSELQRLLEGVFQHRDEAVAQVIVYDPPVLASYDAAQDPSHPSFKRTVTSALTLRVVSLKHGMCAKVELKIQAQLSQWVHIQNQMDAAVATHDLAAAEALQDKLEPLEAEMCKLDAERAKHFVEIATLTERVRTLVQQYRDNNQG